MSILLKTSPLSGSKKHSETKIIATIAIPLAISQLVSSAMGAVDCYFLSQIGEGALGAAGIAVQCFTLISVFSTGLLSIVGVQSICLKNNRKVPSDVLVYVVLLSILFMAVIHFFSDFLTLFHLPIETIGPAKEYLGILKWAILPRLASIAMRFLLAAERNTLPGIWISVAGLSANTIGNVALGSFLGIKGIAIATTISYWMMALLFLCKFTGIRESHDIVTIFKLGFPVALSSLCDTGFFASVTFLAGTFGVEALAAHHLALQFLYIPFMIPYALSIAVSVRVAHSPNEVIKSGLIMSLAPMILISVFYMASFRAHDLILYVAVFQLFNCIQVILLGTLRGMKDTKIPFLLTMLSYWGVGIPVCFFLAKSVQGIWCGMILASSLLSLLLTSRVWIRKMEL